MLTTVPDGRRDRRDLPLEEAVVLRPHGPLLRQRGELVHLPPGHVLDQPYVLRRLTHGDVDVGQAGQRLPR